MGNEYEFWCTKLLWDPFFLLFLQETTEEDIREFFSPFGEIKRINLVMDRETNRSKGFCFVVFSTEISANLALENKTALIKGKRVDIKKAVQSSAKPTIPYVFPQLGFNHKWVFLKGVHTVCDCEGKVQVFWPQKFEKISHLFRCHWLNVKTTAVKDLFQISWTSHNVLTLFQGIIVFPKIVP